MVELSSKFDSETVRVHSHCAGMGTGKAQGPGTGSVDSNMLCINVHTVSFIFNFC